MTTTNSGNWSQTTRAQNFSTANTYTTIETGSVSHEQANLNDPIHIDEVLDRFTLALARQMARDDHEEAVTEQTSKKDQRL
ncbi:hypothetical protein [Microvirga aerophila]|uniref:hypothetical protein n=1 Tax=Microvirga aerophila TaxID=670291 RepID=UPI000DEEF98A|nr:hypothetical protein [Microvirga aerophila]